MLYLHLTSTRAEAIHISKLAEIGTTRRQVLESEVLEI